MTCAYALILVMNVAALGGGDRGQDHDAIPSALAAKILPPGQTLAEVQDFVDSRVPRMPDVQTAAEWATLASQSRADVLAKVVFRGEAARWQTLPTQPEWYGEIDGGPGYRIKKLRFEVVPGMWIPALLYEPTATRGKVPVVLNVNGHDANGKAADYKQIRCINLAKKGVLALNLEWLGMGQLGAKANAHGLINGVDLCGTSGIALHYLAMTRAIDILLAHEDADPTRVGVTGLSGGGWQTAFVSGLDPRVTLANPVAGYSSFRTRVRHLSDLGDSEQTPNDLATIVDYTHLTAMRAPHPTLLTFNAKDNCCFASPHALPPLIDAALPIYALFGRAGNVRSHINHDPGTHNYLVDNRNAFFQMISDHWSRLDHVINPCEIPSDAEVKTAEALSVDLPAGNLTIAALAKNLASTLPRAREPRPVADDLARLRSLVKPILGSLDMRTIREADDGAKTKIVARTLHVGLSWSVPIVEFSRADSRSSTILLGDQGRDALAGDVARLLDQGKRVLAIDVYGFGEAVTPSHAYLFALTIDTVGERTLGVETGQLMAVSRWVAERDGTAPEILAVGPRTSTIALVAAAMEPLAIREVTLRSPMASLKESIEDARGYEANPELFCFGLLEWFDLHDIAGLVAPRPIHLEDASPRASKTLATH